MVLQYAIITAMLAVSAIIFFTPPWREISLIDMLALAVLVAAIMGAAWITIY